MSTKAVEDGRGEMNGYLHSREEPSGTLMPGKEGNHQEGKMGEQKPRRACEWEVLVSSDTQYRLG